MISIEDVYKVYKEHLYLENTHFLDTLMATYFSTRLEGEPVWNFPIAPSSYGKTEQMRPFMKMANDWKYRIVVLDQVTSKAFASGQQGVQGIGNYLQNNKTFILIPDLASILTNTSEEGEELFAVFRTLYDGYIKRNTGSVSHHYKNCHVNMFACSTPRIRDDIAFFSQMGTRELLYDVGRIKEPGKMLGKNVTEDGREEMYQTVKEFIDNFTPVFKEPGKKEEETIKWYVHSITTWRAVPSLSRDGLLKSEVHPEYPARLYRQLYKLWMALKALGINPEPVLSEIKNGVGSPTRQEVINALKPDLYSEKPTLHEAKTAFEISFETRRDPKVIISELMTLWDLGIVNPSMNPFIDTSVQAKWEIVDERFMI